jgi:hypothetical protein
MDEFRAAFEDYVRSKMLNEKCSAVCSTILSWTQNSRVLASLSTSELIFGAAVLHCCGQFKAEAHWNAFCYVNRRESDNEDLSNAMEADAILLEIHDMGNLRNLQLAGNVEKLADLLCTGYEYQSDEIEKARAPSTPAITSEVPSIVLSTRQRC